MNTLKALLLITTALILGGCASTPKSIDGNYTLVSLSNTDTTLDKPIVMQMRETKIAGSGPVNKWRAVINDGKIGPIISTRRIGLTRLMQYESNLLAALEGAQFEFDGSGKLTFMQERDVTAVFQYIEKQPETSK